MAVKLSLFAGAGWQFFDNNGNPLNGGLIESYLAGTSTPATTYTSSSGLIAHSNPIVLDAAGRVPNEIWVTGGANYKFVVKTSANVLIGTYDNISGANDFPAITAEDVSYTPAGSNAVPTNLQAKMEQYVSLSDYTSLRTALATGKQVMIPATTTSINVSTADSPYILPYLDMINAEGDLTLNLATGTHTTASGNIANVGQNQTINIAGYAPLTTTLTAISSVTGSAGAWSVTATLTNATGVAINDVIRLDNVIPGRIYSPSASVTRRPAANEMAVGVYAMGEVSTTTGGTTVNLTKSVASSYLQSGDLVTIRGETKVVDTVGTNSFTVTTPFEFGLTSYQWWYYSIPNTGTITAANTTTVTGTSTLFTSQANIGDLLVVDGCSYKITGITNDTSLTVSHAVTIPASSKFTVFSAGILHAGSFVVTNVSGNNVTFTSKARYVPALPVKAISAGDVVVFKTILKQSGTGDGFVFNRGGIIGNITNTAIVGNNSSTTSSGIRTNYDPYGSSGSYNTGEGTANLGENVSVINWGYGANLSTGCVLNAMGAHFCGNLTRGVSNEDGADSYLREAVISQNNGVGLLVGGGYVRASAASMCANNLQGTRMNVGGSAYGDAWYSWGNGADGVMVEGGCGIHYVDGYSLCNGGNGIDFQNGPSGRITRQWTGGNVGYGISSYNALMEAGQTWSSGNGTTASPYGGVVASRGNADFNYSAQTGNAGAGLFAAGGCTCYAGYSEQRRNNLYGIRSEDFQTLIQANPGYSAYNLVNDRSTDGGLLSDDLTPYGNFLQTAHFSKRVTIANDAVAALYLGTTAKVLTVTFYSESSAALQGAVRIRTISAISTTSIYGTGFVVNNYGTNPTGVLTGTTGTPGDVTLSASNTGYFYIENRSGGSRTMVYDMIGFIQ